MKIGVDFGTTYSKIAYLDAQGGLKLFSYPAGPLGKPYVPTEMVYEIIGQKTVNYVGEAARQEIIHKPNLVYCENFKMLLPLGSAQEWQKQGWVSTKSPAEVTADYLGHLLCNGPQNFQAEVGKIESIVVSVPEVWQQTAANRGADQLQQIVTTTLKLPLDHLRSEPVCAAAYYAYRYQQAEGQSRRKGATWRNLLICDMGGGTFDVALCRVDGSQIEVLDFAGNGHNGLGSAGVSFDRNAVTEAYIAKHSHPPEIDNEDFLQALRDFENRKITSHLRVLDLLELREHEAMIADAPLYSFRDGYTLTYDQVEKAFCSVRTEIENVLSQILSRAAERNHTIDRVAIVGGFGQFPLVQKAILEKLGISDPHDVRFDQTLNSLDNSFAVAYGATLIANDVVKAVEYYPHTIGIWAHYRKGGVLEEGLLPIIEAGTVLGKHDDIHFVRKRGNNSDVTWFEVSSRQNSLPLRIKLRGAGELYTIGTPPGAFPPVGRYSIGLRIDRSNLGSIIFRPSDNRKPDWTCNLGKLEFDLVAKDY